MLKRYKQLRTWNVIAGVFHLLQSIAIYALSNDFTVPIQTNFLKFNEMTFSLEPVRDTVVNVELGPLVALFTLLSAIAHFTISLPEVYDWYIKNLKKKINFARWYEYSLSASLMIVLISMLVGVYDLSTLILMFAVNAGMILFGLMMELHNQTTKKVDWTAFILGCIMGIVPWIVIGLYLFLSGDGENRAPDFVYYIFLSIFLFFNTFAVNQFLQYKKVGKWRDYLYGEKAYIILSFLAKSALAWQVFGGTLRPV